MTQRERTAPRRITVLGSTGSVGCNTLDLIARQQDAFAIEALVAGRNVQRLIEQALQFRPATAVIGDDSKYAELRDALAGTGVAVAAGPSAVIEAAARRADWVMAAIVGAAGLEPTLEAVRRGAVIALANKECLVCAGELFVREVRQAGATLLPVDSEHNAIFQVFDFAHAERVDRIILTASGGPFRTASLDDMRRATPAEAVRHPNWSMGAKISVDSATMMNKGLELIEAFHLFPVREDQIEIVVHPQSVIHSMVGYVDGSVLAQLGTPDMRTPIAYTLAWPDRMTAPAARLDLVATARLTFEAPDPERFPSLRLARNALRLGGAAPTILNAANEVGVARFLSGQIGFLDIVRGVERALERLPNRSPQSLAELRALDLETRRHAGEYFATRSAA
jgi:1-deoxy-D-xylulose-5-phosphate reductoisomerase